jgi:hypothetical protein
VNGVLGGSKRRVGRHTPKCELINGQDVMLKLRCLPIFILTDKSKLAVVGHKHQPVMSKIFCRLRALGRLPSFVGKALYLNDTSLGNLTWGWLATLYLGFSIEPEVRVSGTLVLKLAVADNPWSEVLAEMVQNVLSSFSQTSPLRHLYPSFDRARAGPGVQLTGRPI